VTEDASQLNTNNSNVAADIQRSRLWNCPECAQRLRSRHLNSAVGNTSEGQQLLGGGSNSTDNADQDISFMNFSAVSLERRPSFWMAPGHRP